LVPCGRLSWLLVSFWAHVNIVRHPSSSTVDVSVSGAFHDLVAKARVGRVEGTCLSRLLAEGAAAAAEMRTEVVRRRAVDVAGLADRGADERPADDAGGRDEGQQRVQDAAPAGRLGDLARRVARYDPRDDTQRTVLHTAEQIVLPAAHRVFTHVEQQTATISDQSNLKTGRIAAAHRQFIGVRQEAPVCTAT